ncbi:MAG TPA: TIGR04211 family SH3 domain-containing protein [Thioalkalivibrio sp.]|nr:TIGR04211 family SH3 domain-containing protein [Thioalkalivibrio sp.]
MKSVVLLISLLLLSASLHGQTADISDDLNVAIRSGKTFQHRIMRFVPSGTEVEVLQTDDDGYVLVRTPEGTEGWMERSNLSDQPHARDRLAQTERQLATQRERGTELQQQMESLRGERDEARGQAEETQAELERVATEMETLRVAAARPLELAEENERLRGVLGQTREQAQSLEVQLDQLQHTERREWFMVGAGVAVGSALLGIILTRIQWRRRRDGWS